MKKSLLLFVFASASFILSAQNPFIRFGFEYKDPFDNFNVLDTNAAIEIVLYNQKQDTIKEDYGCDLFILNGTAQNGVHFNITQPIKILFAKYNYFGYRNSQSIKVNAVKDTTFFGKRYFDVRLVALVNLDSNNLNHGYNQLRFFIDYDGTGIGIPKLTFKDYSLYPNPAHDLIFIDGVEAQTFKVFDISGREMLSGEAWQNQINLSELTKGIYVLKCITDKGLITHKIVKE